jgi:5-methylcytosine-specific restriction endonuclease McrA
MCGAAAGEPHPYDATRKTRLHLGHILDKSHGGSDDPSNLRAICSVCNEGAANVTLDRPSAVKLLTQLRRAKVEDQLEVLKWLQTKFSAKARSMLDGG